jgi:glycosyltransferase involved in cell wall biosynthesis
MRVLLSVPEMATGGAERIVVELTRALRAEGDEVAVAADSGPFDRLLKGSGAERYPLPGRGRSPVTAARAALRVRSATRRFRPAVIHAHNVKATGVAAAACLGPRGRRFPLAATFHGVRREEYRRAALILGRADAVACVSQDLLEGLASAGLPRERMRVIHNAVPLPEPLSVEARAALDREFAFEEQPVVSLVGRLSEQKAPQRFLEAAAAVAAEVPQCRFLVVGDGPLRAPLELLADRLGLTGSVRFTGVRRNARDLIARSDVVVFSSEWEGLPMVALEALAAAVPVVSTDVEGMRELLGMGAGVVVPRDADALAREIVALIQAPDRRAQMGRTGRERIATEFSVERMVEAYQGLYRELASAGR